MGRNLCVVVTIFSCFFSTILRATCCLLLSAPHAVDQSSWEAGVAYDMARGMVLGIPTGRHVGRRIGRRLGARARPRGGILRGRAIIATATRIGACASLAANSKVVATPSPASRTLAYSVESN